MLLRMNMCLDYNNQMNSRSNHPASQTATSSLYFDPLSTDKHVRSYSFIPFFFIIRGSHGKLVLKRTWCMNNNNNNIIIISLKIEGKEGCVFLGITHDV